MWNEIKSSIADVKIRRLKEFIDDRGTLCEIFRLDEWIMSNELSMSYPAMCYISTTYPGICRGPHEHKNQTDYFAFVLSGMFEVYLWDNRTGSDTEGVREKWTVGQNNPSIIVVPPGIVHAYKNISETKGLVINCPDTLYKGPGKVEEVDEIRHENDKDTVFKLW